MTNDEPRRPDELLIGELTEQLDRTRRLLGGSPGDAAEAALARLGGASEVDAQLTRELAETVPLAAPERFLEAHRLVMRSLELLERDGHRTPPGRITALGRLAVGFVARYIVRSHTSDVVGTLATLYSQRESQSEPGSRERRLLASARAEVMRLEPRYGGGGVSAPLLLAVGAALPALASLGQQVGAIDLDRRWVLPGVVVPLVLFAALAWLLLRGAAVARHRSRLVAGQPLAALWETIGNAGDPPEDAATAIATVSIVLTALVWFALPALFALPFVLF